ncbi:hypothetical protein G7046_g6171 [Stylonectria norvegica]|nr:hypothetical protein G7046_g6171 [Stylonectria norvegica]
MASYMKSWICATPGYFAQTLKLVEDAPKPSKALQDGQILVQVISASLNPADYKVPELGIAGRAIVSFPKTPGMDLSGRVVGVSDGTSDVKTGDLVIARLQPTKQEGSLAQFVVVDRDGYATLPSNFDVDQAAGAPTAALTAYQTIAPYVKPGDKVFINGGSGGVGTFGIQIAKAMGCHVTASCSTEKASLCKDLGADEIINYKTTNVTAELKQRGPIYSLVVDNMGNAPPDLYSQVHHFTVPGSKYVFVGGAVSFSSAINLARSLLLPGFLGGGQRKFVPFICSNDRANLQQIAQWMVEGQVKTIVDSVFEFEQTREAFEKLKKGSSAGKVVVRVAARDENTQL